MSSRTPTQEEQDNFWVILKASAAQWKAIELERLLMYFLRSPATGSDDAAVVAEAGFKAFTSASPKQRSELIASVSATEPFKLTKKALGIRRAKTPAAPSVAANLKRLRGPKPGPSKAQLLEFWERLESCSEQWAAPINVDNLLAYYLRAPLSNAATAQEVVQSHRTAFFEAHAELQREAMAGLSQTPEMKAAVKSSLLAARAKPAPL